MIAMCRKLGFAGTPDPQDADLYVVTLTVPETRDWRVTLPFS